MTTEELKQQAHKEFDEKFPDSKYRELLGDYADHAPMSQHGEDGECVCCPAQYWHIDDLFPEFKSFIDSLIDKTVQHEQDRIVGLIQNALSDNKLRTYLTGTTKNIEVFIEDKSLISLITNKNDINK